MIEKKVSDMSMQERCEHFKPSRFTTIEEVMPNASYCAAVDDCNKRSISLQATKKKLKKEKKGLEARQKEIDAQVTRLELCAKAEHSSPNDEQKATLNKIYKYRYCIRFDLWDIDNDIYNNDCDIKNNKTNERRFKYGLGNRCASGDYYSSDQYIEDKKRDKEEEEKEKTTITTTGLCMHIITPNPDVVNPKDTIDEPHKNTPITYSLDEFIKETDKKKGKRNIK